MDLDEQVTELDVLALFPVLVIVIFISWLLSLFGYSRSKKELSLRQQQREYRKSERKLMKEFK